MQKQQSFQSSYQVHVVLFLPGSVVLIALETNWSLKEITGI